MSHSNGKLQFDFSDLYSSEVVEVKNHAGKVVFTATVREITHGEKTQAQTAMLANIDMPTGGSKERRKHELELQMKQAMKNGVSANISLYEEVAAIQSWTLTNQGKPVPVCVEAWKALPMSLASQIVTVIERLNPDVDEDFRSEAGNAGTTEGDV